MGSIDRALKDFFDRSPLPVLFAGAGVSVKAGLPDWENYLSKLGAAAFEYDEYTKYMIDRSVQDHALADAAAYYMMCRQMPESSKLKGLVEPLGVYETHELKSLVQLPFQSVVTTNFDRALFSAYAEYAGKSVEEVNIDDPTLDAAAFSQHMYIARIHGRVEIPQSMRLTTEKLNELARNNSYQQFLEHIFTRRQVIFMGFSFLDPAIRTVLQVVRLATRSMHKQEHMAIVPETASSDFIRELEKHSIRRVTYSPSENHEELWIGVGRCAADQLTNLGGEKDVRKLPFTIAKKYLATAFARARIGKQREPLVQVIVEGIVSGIIQSSADDGVREDLLIERLTDDLSLEEGVARGLVIESVNSLARSGVCRLENGGESVKYIAIRAGESVYDQAISRLIDGVINRYSLLERGQDSPGGRIYLQDMFGKLLLTRGWDLGAAFAARKMPEDVNVANVADGLDARGMKPSEVFGLVRAVESLLMRPEEEEAELLAELGRTAFGLELLLEGPHDPVFLRRTLPERIYFDTNVIMPAITLGHPHNELFIETIKSLKTATETAGLNLSLRVYEGFLNEIVSHKQLARDAMMAYGGEGALWEKRAVGLYGSGNVNVFIGAYFNYIVSHLGVSFEDFLSIAAPYDSEAELRGHLSRIGLQIIRDDQARKSDNAGILHALEKYNSTKLETMKKSATVVRHDANQLSIVKAELEHGVRTMFVSADRGIRVALEYEGYSSLSNSMITHLGLAQLVELLIGHLPAERGLASLLWMSHVSDDTNRIRNYLISLALKEHDAALAMTMSEIVNDIAEDAGMELSGKQLQLSSEDISERREINRTLERYESRFFEKMKAEVDRIREK